jgi:hypothetical protein
MSKLDRVLPQATQLPILNRIVEMVVLGEQDRDWMRDVVGFRNRRNVDYYLEAARWMRLVEELGPPQPTALGRKYVAGRFDPRIALQGLRGRSLFDDVIRASRGTAPTVYVVADVLRRWSFRYSQSTLERRANDFTRLFGRIVREANEPDTERFDIRWARIPSDRIATVGRSPLLWPKTHIFPLGGRRQVPK